MLALPDARFILIIGAAYIVRELKPVNTDASTVVMYGPIMLTARALQGSVNTRNYPEKTLGKLMDCFRYTCPLTLHIDRRLWGLVEAPAAKIKEVVYAANKDI
jgi:hypothetical protein